ncbi:MAG: tetratricopeptide repeat protein [Deltaproteobacteria bacterium]|nr:tetratricopeptide repeat protein [Deltaproteobacteria bacterium]
MTAVAVGWLAITPCVTRVLAADDASKAAPIGEGSPFANHAANGVVAYRRHDFNQAIAELEKAVAIFQDPRLMALLASAYAESGRLDDSLAQYAKALTAEPTNAETHKQAGIVYLRKNDAAQALSHLKRAVELKPDDAEMHLALGKGLFLAQSPAAARAEFEKVLQKSPNDAEARAGIGACLHASGQFEDALREYLRALELGHEPNTLYGAMVTALKSYSEIGDARPYAKKALLYYPGNETFQVFAQQPQK